MKVKYIEHFKMIGDKKVLVRVQKAPRRRFLDALPRRVLNVTGWSRKQPPRVLSDDERAAKNRAKRRRRAPLRGTQA